MGDLLRDLARTKPPTPDVDPERMERDLAQILTLPRPQPPSVWRGQAAFRRRLAPIAVAFGVAALLMIALLPSDRSDRVAGPAEWWHVRTAQTQLIAVGDDADPYVLELRTDTDHWLTPQRQVVLYQQNGHVGWRSEADLTRWLAAGSPPQVPMVGATNRQVRIGPVRTAVSEARDGNFVPSLYLQVPFNERDTLPADPDELLDVLKSLAPGEPGGLTYRVARLAMGMMAAPLRLEQRQAALALLRKLDGVRNNGVGLALAAPPAGQFTNLETQLVVDLSTAQAVNIRNVIKSAQHGLPAGAAVETQDFLDVGVVADSPQLPADVPVNGDVDSPFIMVR